MSNERLPSQSLLMQLRDERNIILEAYAFLDEKRLLLAAELLRQLEVFDRANSEYMALHEQAHAALKAALGEHGLQGLQVYSAYDLDASELIIRSRKFMGVGLIESRLQLTDGSLAVSSCKPSVEADHCRDLFLQLLESATRLAGISSNMQRLLNEYQKTERRARALENIVLPELEQDLRKMTTQLEEQDLEETTRLHLKH